MLASGFGVFVISPSAEKPLKLGDSVAQTALKGIDIRIAISRYQLPGKRGQGSRDTEVEVSGLEFGIDFLKSGFELYGKSVNFSPMIVPNVSHGKAPSQSARVLGERIAG